MELSLSSEMIVLVLGFLLLGFIPATLVKILLVAHNPSLRKIPGPWLSAYTGLPLKIAFPRGRRSVYIHALHERYGKYIRIAPQEVAIADTEAFRIIHRIGSEFNKSDFYTTSSPDAIDSDHLPIFFVRSNKEASHRRRLYQAAGTKKIVAEWEPQVIELVNLCVEKMKAELINTGSVDVVKWWTFLASDVTGSLAFGQTLNHIRNGKKSQFIHDIEALLPVDGIVTMMTWLRPFLLSIPAWIPGSPLGVYNRMQKWGQEAVQATRAAQQSDNRKTLFSKMIRDDEKEQLLTDAVIEFDAVNIVVAGTDSTAMTLTYLCFAVMGDPEVQKKLVQELKSCSRDPRREELESLPYLNAVIEETLRLYPAAPASIPRIVPEGEENVGKYVIPAGTVVATQSYSFQRDPTVFADPLKFNPSRWLSVTPAMKEHMVTFGGPARICFGRNIARLELLHAVSKFFRECPDVKLHESTTMESMEMVDYFAIQPKSGKCVVVRE